MTSFNRAQRAYDAQLPPEPQDDPTENFSDAEFAAAVLRWLDAGGPVKVLGHNRSREQEFRDWIADFVRGEQA